MLQKILNILGSVLMILPIALKLLGYNILFDWGTFTPLLITTVGLIVANVTRLVSGIEKYGVKPLLNSLTSATSFMTWLISLIAAYGVDANSTTLIISNVLAIITSVGSLWGQINAKAMIQGFLTSMLVLMMIGNLSAQTMVLDEVITPVQCSTTKEPAFTQALKPYVDAEQVIEIIADYRDTMNIVDFNNRYRSFYVGGSSQTCRYMGLYGTRYNIGSLWADNINGIYNMAAATKIKTDSMIAENNRSGWKLSATSTEVNKTVTVKITRSAPKATTCNMVVLLIDQRNHFRQTLSISTVTVRRPIRTVTVKGLSQYSNCKVVVLFQDTNTYTPDCVTPSWCEAEHIVYAATKAKP